MFFQNNSAVELLNFDKPKTIFTVENNQLKIKIITGVKIGNLILNWPKLLRPFEELLKPFFHVISMCMCSQCDSTSLPVQRSQIYLL